MKTLADYRTETRYEIDDYNATIENLHSDAELNYLINEARTYLNQDLLDYRKPVLLFPKAHIDSYDLPADFITALNLVDIETSTTINPTKSNKAKMLQNRPVSYFYDLFYIDENKRKIIFLTSPDTADEEPDYSVILFDRANKNLTLNSSTGTFGDISNWTGLKGYLKLVNGANTEYVRYSYIDYKEASTITGNTTSASTTIDGISDTSDLLAGATVTGSGIPAGAYITAVATSSITISAAATATATGVSISVGDVAKVYIGDSNVTHDADITVDYASGTATFATYALNYIADPPALVNDTDEDVLSREVQDIVKYAAAMNAYLRESRTNLAGYEAQRVQKEIAAIRRKLNIEKARLHNQSLDTITDNSFWF